jgi:hypothetical protein
LRKSRFARVIFASLRKKIFSASRPAEGENFQSHDGVFATRVDDDALVRVCVQAVARVSCMRGAVRRTNRLQPA